MRSLSKRSRRVVAALALVLVAGGAPAVAEPGHGGHGEHPEYRDADCTPADDAAGDESVQVVEEREHHGNGRTECVLVDGAAVFDRDGDQSDDWYIAYDPYQEDEIDGNSRYDRGPAVRYHNGDKYRDDGGHAHGGYGCWDPAAGAATLEEASPDERAEEAARGEAELQASLWAALDRYTGTFGFTNALADGWYFYPVPASKSLHMVRTRETDPSAPGQVESVNVESFMIAMTDDGWQPLNGMFMLGNEGDDDPAYDANGGRAAKGAVDYKIVPEERLPLWESDQPGSTIVCDLPWHTHVDAEGVATSFDREHPDVSAWMAHIALYAMEGDPWGMYSGHDGSEPHAYWAPYRYVPALCNPGGPCL